MDAALLGFAGVSVAALFTLAGVVRSSRAPVHLADVEGMSRLVDQLQEERDGWRARAIALEAALAECRAEIRRKG